MTTGRWTQKDTILCNQAKRLGIVYRRGEALTFRQLQMMYDEVIEHGIPSEAIDDVFELYTVPFDKHTG